jgi:hypothetical protein
MAIPNAAQARVVWRSTIKPDFDMNILGVLMDPGFAVDQTMADNIGNAIAGAFNTSTWKTRVANSYSLDSIFVRDLRIDNLPELAAAITPVFGTNTGDEYAFHSAGVVTLRTALAGKSFRGRTYYGGVTETFVDGGTMLGTAYADLVTFARSIRTALEALVGVDGQGVISRLLQVITPIPTDASIVGRSGIMGTQRRRLERP